MTDALALAAVLAAGSVVAPAPVPEIGAVKEVEAVLPAGRFLLQWREPKRVRNEKWAELLKGSRLFEDHIDALNAHYALPFDIPVVAEDCGEPNAYYLPEKRRIRMCHELLGDSTRRIRPHVSPRRSAPDVALADVLHAFYHEVGHALIDAYKLPTVGREEDAVDQFATLILLDSGPAGAEAAQVAALEYKLSARESSPDFADEHSVDRQRAYNILCLVYGAHPRKYAGLIGRGSLPKARAETCREEYLHLKDAWKRLLAPHYRL
ncbi:MAG: hypothetical protein HY925_08365 [Elusimicrobia bacterium]|nr:hypothetical protein [Elusimicrobiota bacterium]